MIYITGDTHFEADLEKITKWEVGATLTRNDYLIICGDTGLTWDNTNRTKALQQYFSRQPYTTLFIDGNHENFDLLYSYPTSKAFGGTVRKIADNLYHLCRGEYYTIDGTTFWVFGGAQSLDKWMRREGESWWAAEMPTREEMEYGISVLERHNNTCDFIVTHDCPKEVLHYLYPYAHNDALHSFFSYVADTVNFKRWYFGHHHQDMTIDDRFTCLYNTIQEIGE